MFTEKIKLPSNLKFGITFSVIFIFFALFFWFKGNNFYFILFLILSSSFLIVSLLKSSLLYPLNIAWMYFGYFLGKIISPVIIGILFFVIVTPIALFMKIFGRDELMLKKNKTKTFWKNKKNNLENTSFLNQF